MRPIDRLAVVLTALLVALALFGMGIHFVENVLMAGRDPGWRLAAIAYGRLGFPVILLTALGLLVTNTMRGALEHQSSKRVP